MMTTITVYAAYISKAVFSSSGTECLSKISKAWSRFSWFFFSPKRIISEVWRSCGWGCLSVTWPDDRLQQRHPASKKLKVCLQVVEHLQTNVLSESNKGTVWGWGEWVGGWRHQAESRGCSWLFPLPVPAGRYGGSVKRSHLWPLPKADPASGLLLTMNTDHSLKD